MRLFFMRLFFMRLFNLCKAKTPKSVVETPICTEETLLSVDIKSLENFDNNISIFNGFIKIFFSSIEQVKYIPISKIHNSTIIKIERLTKDNDDGHGFFEKGFKYIVLTPILCTPFYKKENAEKYAEKVIELLNKIKTTN